MLELNIENPDELVLVAHALSTDLRVNIIQLLNTKKLNINEIADALQIPVSTAASNVKILEKARLIETELLPATRGAMKVCTRTYHDIHIILNSQFYHLQPDKNCYEIEMPIGYFTNCQVSPTCGMANTEKMIIQEDSPAGFFHPDRFSAQIIWFRKGFVDYRFPLELPKGAKIQSVQFSFEICSEAPNYDNNWPSDISFWVNGVDVGTWTSPGDFGGRKGKLNPGWWSESATQFGLLKTLSVDGTMTAIDNVQVSSVNLHQLVLGNNSFIDLRLGVKDDATHKGGINLFGNKFGDYEQGIVMKVFFTV
ncbi:MULTISPECIES: ArsR/SmtB family transcription factor [unclassified Paenibacillus]|uniref:ArsR/SmtB family transcription factor n=1 Tax=unclassified Paenibacillus TaxID=185978 RepID=UPI00070B4726|nr:MULTISPECIES: ArsR family transcriptional regulator [unclassified Paenibacillus]KQX48518.1 ArsR family transcriptional regulator [Paenibacillus sp. Root444D2]KRE49797.1 ArsR family transcriptional regulator [Paenibacillus sp. Soil724D2]